jgi:hypothetical protein
MKQETTDRTPQAITRPADSLSKWLSIEWEELKSLKVTFNLVGEVLVKLFKQGQIDLSELSKKIKGSILKNECDGSSLPIDLKEEAKNDRSIVIKLRNNKIKVFDFEKECTLSIPIESTFSRKFHEFAKIIVQQAAA